MKLPKELTAITPLSRSLGFIVLIGFLLIGFSLGIQYQETIDLAKKQPNNSISIISPRKPRHTIPIDETANWKTYTGRTYSFKYPADASVRTEDNYSFMTAKKVSQLVVEPPRIAPFVNWYSFSIMVEDNNFNLDSKGLISNYVTSLRKENGGDTTAKKVESSMKLYTNGAVNGIVADYGFDYNRRIVVQTNNKTIYTFQINGDNGQYTSSNLQILDQILSTFQFAN